MNDKQRNILNPFRRDRKRDFASGTGPELLRSKVLQAIMTRGVTAQSSGELPWRTAFGAGLDLLRHQRNDAALSELARIYIRDTLKKWVPEVVLLKVTAVQKEANLQLEVRFRPSGRNNRNQNIEDLSVSIPQ
jgi:phage baseplate assembly protein W